MVNSREICDAAGIKASKTLTRWHQRGLIPEPEISTHPDGRGKISYWQDWVLVRCKHIRIHVDAGRSLDDVARLFSKPRYRLKEMSERIDYEHAISDFVIQTMEKVVAANFVTSQALRKIDRQVASRKFAEQALSFVRDGINPIICIDRDAARIMPDFMVSHALSGDGDKMATMLVLSIFSETVGSFSSVVPDLPVKPSVGPVAKISERTGKRFRESDFDEIELVSCEAVKKMARSRLL